MVVLHSPMSTWNHVTCALRLDILALASVFYFCDFCWVTREANMAVHALAKLAPLLNLLIVYFPNNLPWPLVKAWFKKFRCILFLVY